MVIDTSAIIAILFEEPECDRIATAIATSSKHLISAFTALECGIVIEDSPAKRLGIPKFCKV